MCLFSFANKLKEAKWTGLGLKDVGFFFSSLSTNNAQNEYRYHAVFVLQKNRLDRFSRIAQATMFSKRADERKQF